MHIIFNNALLFLIDPNIFAKFFKQHSKKFAHSAEAKDMYFISAQRAILRPQPSQHKVLNLSLSEGKICAYCRSYQQLISSAQRAIFRASAHALMVLILRFSGYNNGQLQNKYQCLHLVGIVSIKISTLWEGYLLMPPPCG